MSSKPPVEDPLVSLDPKNRDVVTGQFKTGHEIRAPGAGRPKGTLNFMKIAREKAKKAKIPLEDLVWLATKGLAMKAARGDAAAAKILLDRMCGSIDKGVEVNVDARTAIATGPPVPQGGDFEEWVRGINKVAAQQNLLEGATPEQIEHEAATAAELEAELLG